jgi:hypothetical protein
VKPSRFGSIERLFAAYDYCEARGIGAYGGGRGSSARGAGTFNFSQRSSIPTRRTTSRRASSTSTRKPGLPSPLGVERAPTGFLAL